MPTAEKLTNNATDERTSGRRVNPGIQVARALAVVLVLVYHYSPGRLPGGFVGVDVFFVISGFLISGHLVNEYETSGRIILHRFYARRIRRLLPSALLVLAVTAAAMVVLVPRTHWLTPFQQIAASAGYVENWALSAQSVDYLHNLDVSPVQHFWSLSVEEQFYLFWPILLLAAGVIATAVARRRAAVGTSRVIAIKRGLLVIMVGASGLSLVWSIASTVFQPALAYFSTATRAWEFGAGAILAMIPLAARTRMAKIGFLAAGLVAIVASALLFGAATPFPGWEALVPVVGTCFLLIAVREDVGLRWAATIPGRIAVRVGDLSYLLYLWHWPILVIAGLIAPAPISGTVKVIALTLTLVLTLATARFVETPFRRVGLSSPGRTIGIGLLCSALVASAALSVLAYDAFTRAQTLAHINAVSTKHPSCFGAAALADCARPFAVTSTVVPEFARSDIGVAVALGKCELGLGSELQTPCVFGATRSPLRTIALLGDSHAGQYIEALDPAFAKRGWRLQTYIKGGCPGLLPAAGTGGGECLDWGVKVVNEIAHDPTISAVIISNATTKYPFGSAPIVSDAVVDHTVSVLRSAGKAVYFIRDTPGSPRDAAHNSTLNFPSCIEKARGSYDPCAVRRADVISNDVMVRAAARDHVGLVDLTNYFCDQTLCHAVIGGLIVYADGEHITTTYARTLADPIGAQLATLISRAN